jgi:hypothetical protein
MVVMRNWFLVMALASSIGAACGGKSIVEGGDGEDATGGTGESGGRVEPGTGGTGGAETGGSAGSGNGGIGPTGSGSAGPTGRAGAPPECADIMPCGGDFAGSWAVASSCLTVSGALDVRSLGIGCAEARITGVLAVKGTWTADPTTSTYTDNTTTTGTELIELAPACLNISGTVTTCDRIAGILPAFGYSSATCSSTDGGGCSCVAYVEQLGSMGVVAISSSTFGNYTTSRHFLTVSGGFEDVDYTYCASASRLSMVPMVTGVTGSVTGAIVLERLAIDR